MPHASLRMHDKDWAGALRAFPCSAYKAPPRPLRSQRCCYEPRRPHATAVMNTANAAMMAPVPGTSFTRFNHAA